MNCNFWHSFYCVMGGWLVTFIAHVTARYIVGTPIFPSGKLETPSWITKICGFKQVSYGLVYNKFLASSIFFFFSQFFHHIMPTLSVEQACAFTLFYFTLAVTIITDFYTYLISTLMTLFLVPAIFFYAHMGYLQITLQQSIISALIVGCCMTLINFLYERRRGAPAFGEGDRDLLIYIAAFLGWFSTLLVIFYGSLIGSIWGIVAMVRNKESLKSQILPFGTCLGFGVFIHILISHFYGPLF